MSRFLAKQDGIALVTALMLTLISLTIVMAVMYMITQSIQQTGANKRYKTALEASYGGTDILMKEIVPLILKDFASTPAALVTDLEGTYSMLGLKVLADPQCLKDKLTLGTDAWSAGCSQLVNPKASSDMSFQLQATGGQPYTVYTKVVDTIFGNSDTSGLQLEGAGVAESTSVITPQHIPFVYRVEVQAEKANNATEQANMSILYAY
jgi:hypothetical protein